MSQIQDDSLGWILIHSEARYAGETPNNPIAELEENWPNKKWNRLWHWKRPSPLREDDTPKKVLLAWKNEVFGEATATVTHKIGKHSSSYNFAFKLDEYQLLPYRIPLISLQLGSRAHNHRDLIRLGPESWAAYLTEKGAEAAVEIETIVNPQKQQGFGLNAAERKAVELHAMGMATDFLKKEGFDVEDVSQKSPFDLLATKAGKSISVEVKGTTGIGDAILLTKNEIEHQKAAHPANMIIIVHSIALKKGITPSTRAGNLRVISPWKIEPGNLTPTAFLLKM